MKAIKRLPWLVRLFLPFLRWWPTPSAVYLRSWSQLHPPFGKVRLAMAQEHSLQMHGCRGWLPWFWFRVTRARQRRQFDIEAWEMGIIASGPVTQEAVSRGAKNPEFCFFR